MGTGVQKVRSQKELAASLSTSTDSAARTVWVHESLVEEVRRSWEFRSGTVEAFGRNILLFKNLRQHMLGTHIQEGQSLRATIEQWAASVEVYREELRHDPHSGMRAPMENTLSTIHYLETRLASLGSEEAFGREMAFVYLISTLDGFVAGWALDMGLASEGKLPQGDSKTI